MEMLKLNPLNQFYNSFCGIDQLPRGRIKIGDKLGSGAFGDVFCGDWEDRKITLKKIDIPSACKNFQITIDEAKEVLKWEISRHSTLSHPNLVQFHGIYQHHNESYTYFVMELCSKGTLENILKNNNNISWSKRWMWSLQMYRSIILFT